ncbi:uncharacterized protein LOC133909643 isoform X3 [Phragmites australis]|uniref:uncharacterized protein LOC133909643 isoform X3 n=1 Tax=Phragmites australis TaxID=29695 RepID=UPI002D77EF5D|nr:uncharacterized protein LOC133909643 isoform X3 [Phragmites australis]
MILKKKPVYSMKKGQIVRVEKEKYLNCIHYQSVGHPPFYKGLHYIYKDRGEFSVRKCMHQSPLTLSIVTKCRFWTSESLRLGSMPWYVRHHLLLHACLISLPLAAQHRFLLFHCTAPQWRRGFQRSTMPFVFGFPLDVTE